jgi:hypothetical protein
MAEFTEAEREADAASGAALPDGSFPIENCQDLRNAVQAYGRARPEHRAAVRRHIARRKIELGCDEELPESWHIERGHN